MDMGIRQGLAIFCIILSAELLVLVINADATHREKHVCLDEDLFVAEPEVLRPASHVAPRGPDVSLGRNRH